MCGTKLEERKWVTKDSKSLLIMASVVRRDAGGM
jgi:hypothetical protein